MLKRAARGAADRAFVGLSRAAGAVGLDVVRRDYHSPIPDLARLPSNHFDTAQPVPGVAWDAPAQLRLLEEELAPYIAEFERVEYQLENDSYESVDAETLWAMVRHLKPRRIVELGSGFTTLVLAAALKANAADGGHALLSVFDPYPRRTFDVPVERVSAVDVPIEWFTALGTRDILFVDTTHTVKTGGDVNRIVLDVLPQLAPGVYVHFHDVFLPYDYPEHWLRLRRFFWAEQYLLQAFLACNPDFEIVLATNAIVQEYPERVAAVVPSFSVGVQPGAFWIRRL